MKTMVRILLASLALIGLLGLTGCSITPGIGMGIAFDYSGGEFHARPNVSVGLYGHP